MILIIYDAPQTIRSAAVFAPGGAMMFVGADILPVLEASRDGEWQPVVELPLDKVPTTVSFAPVTAQEFRIVLHPFQEEGDSPASWEGAPGAIGFGFPDNKAETIRIAELHLSGEPRINRFEQKAGFSVAKDYYALDGNLSLSEEGVAPDSMVDLTPYLQADGTLAWTPPPGSWRVLRFGYSLVGTENHPAPPEGTGLEVDKYDGDAVAQYLRDYLAIFRDASGGMVGEHGIGAILTDSIEAGASNWTPRMMEHFERLRGYDPRPWLPALAGVLVGSRAQSDAFLFDFRRTLVDLLAEQHYKTVADFAHEQGLEVYGEALEDNRPSLGDDMAMRAHADYPMAAYWAHPRDREPRPTYIGDMKGAASVGHLYGRNVVAAESLTSAGFPWALAPVDLKPLIDIQFAHGINRPVIHSSVHQPVDDYLPGMSMLSIGQFFNRHVTWADMARPWVDYMARSSYLLQQGRNVADVLYFHGEEAPLTALFAGNRLPDLPSVFAYDFANADVILNQLSVDDGELVASSGARYKVLYLGGTSSRMTGKVLEKLLELAGQGAVITGAAPEKSPSLADDPQRFSVQASRLALIGSERGAAKGRFIQTREIDTTLLELGVVADFSFTAEEGDAELMFLHRHLDDGEIYFVANRRNEAVRGEARFRVTGRVPEIWRADSGAIEPVSYRFDGDQTVIPLDMSPEDAFFIVFGKPAQVPELTVPTPREAFVADVEGPWSVTFQENRGAPESAIFPTLVSLSESDDAGIRYFSGVSTYSNTLVLPESLDAEAQVFLDLGEVGDLAEVSVNGETAGIAWKRPYRVDVGGMLRAGENTLEIRVANLWANRLIGDAQPGVEKVTTIVLPTYRPDAPLRPAGLIGPVRLGVKQ